MTEEISAQLDRLEELGDQLLRSKLAVRYRHQAVARFDQFGPHDVRGSTLWHVADDLDGDPKVSTTTARPLKSDVTQRDIDVLLECAHPSRPDREDLVRKHIERILSDRATVQRVAPDGLLCSQCGEQMACMVKVGTRDGWCASCLDEAAEPVSGSAPPGLAEGLWIDTVLDALRSRGVDVRRSDVGRAYDRLAEAGSCARSDSLLPGADTGQPVSDTNTGTVADHSPGRAAGSLEAAAERARIVWWLRAGLSGPGALNCSTDYLAAIRDLADVVEQHPERFAEAPAVTAAPGGVS